MAETACFNGTTFGYFYGPSVQEQELVRLSPVRPLVTLAEWRDMRDRAAYAMRAGTIASYARDAFGPDGSACLGMYAAMKGGGMIAAGMPPGNEIQVYYGLPNNAVCDRAQYLYAMVCKLTGGAPFTTNVSNLLHLLDRKIAELEEHEISASEPMEPTKSVTVEAKEGELVCV